ncbi:unnamed protein product [Rotaria sordida]|uniref:Uncharacterized protein n=1 Tax=Rotaria sordida TaxID=392033 RepID=A0A814TEP4_9BILA|nr:unnamed protein product [Rotaria sordida]
MLQQRTRKTWLFQDGESASSAISIILSLSTLVFDTRSLEEALGGWNDMYYMALRKQIDLVRNHCKIKMKQNNSSSPNNFEFFIGKIMLNLIGFNMPVKKSNDKNKEAGDDDSPNDYVVDATIIYDRSLNPHTFIIGQYAGREHQMGTNRNDSLLQVIYEFDAILKNFQAFICANARGSPYYTDLLNQVLLNVNSQLYIYDSFLDDNFKTKIDTLLSRVKKTTILYE